MNVTHRLFIACLFLALIGVPVLGNDEQADLRLSEMTQRVQLLNDGATEKSKLRFLADRPLFRYSDPTRDILDATIWRYGSEGRPKAILVLEYVANDKGEWSYEMTTTSPDTSETIHCRSKKEQWEWEPDGASMDWLTLTDTQKPAEDSPGRKAQMKEIARRLRATEEFRGVSQLRLMPRPLTRYSDLDGGIIEGCIYALAHGANAELLVLIEAQKSEDRPAKWNVAFARLGIAKLDVAFDGRPIWNTGYHNKTNDYMNRVETDNRYLVK